MEELQFADTIDISFEHDYAVFGNIEWCIRCGTIRQGKTTFVPGAHHKISNNSIVLKSSEILSCFGDK